MKTYTFYMTEYSDVPGMEMTLYTSNDVNGRFVSERPCFISVLEDCGINYDLETALMLDLYTLERICLDNSIYVQFIDDQGE